MLLFTITIRKQDKYIGQNYLYRGISIELHLNYYKWGEMQGFKDNSKAKLHSFHLMQCMVLRALTEEYQQVVSKYQDTQGPER